MNKYIRQNAILSVRNINRQSHSRIYIHTHTHKHLLTHLDTNNRTNVLFKNKDNRSKILLRWMNTSGRNCLQ